MGGWRGVARTAEMGEKMLVEKWKDLESQGEQKAPPDRQGFGRRKLLLSQGQMLQRGARRMLLGFFVCQGIGSGFPACPCPEEFAFRACSSMLLRRRARASETGTSASVPAEYW